MTPDKIRAAAERQRRLQLPGVTHEDVYPESDWYKRHDDDVYMLADAWLAEHPADDGEPVTEEWLKAVGFLNEDEENPTFWAAIFEDLNPAFTIQVLRDGNRHQGFIGEAEDYIPWPHDIVSRQQVRSICRALGVNLTRSKR